MNWDIYFINLAHNVSLKSKDRSTKVGALIIDEHNHIVATGYNGFPKGIDDENPEYHERPLKYDMTEHAERNAIYQAAARSGGTRGTTLYLGHNPEHGICTDCARAIIQAGIKRVVGPIEHKFMGQGEQWHLNTLTAHHMLQEAGVVVEAVCI